MLTELTDGVFRDAGPAHVLGMPLTSTMTVIRLAGGDLIVCSPLPLTAERRAEVTALRPGRAPRCAQHVPPAGRRPTDRGAARASVDELLDHAFDALVVGHGAPLVEDARATLASATRFLTPAAPRRLLAPPRARSSARGPAASGCRPARRPREGVLAHMQ